MTSNPSFWRCPWLIQLDVRMPCSSMLEYRWMMSLVIFQNNDVVMDIRFRVHWWPISMLLVYSGRSSGLPVRMLRLSLSSMNGVTERPRGG